MFLSFSSVLPVSSMHWLTGHEFVESFSSGTILLSLEVMAGILLCIVVWKGGSGILELEMLSFP